MNSALHRQRGVSTIMLILLIASGAFIGLFAAKVGPIYYEYMSIARIADETTENATVMSQTPSKVYTHIGKAYRTNNLWDVKAEDTISMRKEKGKVIIDVDYEKRVPLFANIEIVTVFKKTAGTP